MGRPDATEGHALALPQQGRSGLDRPVRPGAARGSPANLHPGATREDGGAHDEGRAHGEDFGLGRRRTRRFQPELTGPGSPYLRLVAKADQPPMSRLTRLWRSVSTRTLAVMPARNGGSPGCGNSRSRTGRRCTTFTQLPEAFCGGSTANSAPVAGLMLSISACQTTSG